MPLRDVDLIEAMETGELSVTPVSYRDVQPASIDLHLAPNFRYWPPSPNLGRIIDPYEEGDFSRPRAAVRGKVYIAPGEFLLAATSEWVTLKPTLVGRVEGKSSLARLGLIIHTTAGFIDPGFSGSITLELLNVNRWPITLTVGMPICQLSIDRLSGPANSYSGKYGGTRGVPEASKYWKNPRPENG
jgi:dCTP deaminase